MRDKIQWVMLWLVALCILSALFGVMLPVAVGCGLLSVVVCTALYVWTDREEI